MDPFAAKAALIAAVDLPHEVFHIYAGMLIQLGFCILLSKKLADWQPLYFVYAIELLNEVLDCLNIDRWLDQPFIDGFIMDFVHTCALPTLISLLARFTWIARR